jgi:hypothetical protein
MRHATPFVLGLGAVASAASLLALAPEPPRLDPRVARMTDAARAFAASLSDAERVDALLPLDDPRRTQWFFARGGRDGLFLEEMDGETKAAALALVDAFLSPAGREQWRLIRATEALNAIDEKAAGVSPATYGGELYVARLFGSPDDPAWAFEIEGHHFVLHAAVADGVATVTPVFTGAFPVAVPRGPDAGSRPLGAAVEVAFELARSFDDAQRVAARIMDRTPADVLWATGADAKAPEPKGVARRDMTPAQQAIVDRLLATHAGLLDEAVADAQLREWRTHHAGELSFAFVGETDLARPHYYRLASPSFTIEYGSTNADASHVHCVWSDPRTNFGGDPLRAHLSKAHGADESSR